MLAQEEIEVFVFAAANILEVSTPGCQAGEAAAAIPGKLGFDRSVHSCSWGEGAAAIVLMPLKRATAEGRRIYAVLRSYSTRGGKTSGNGRPGAGDLLQPPALEDLRGCCQEALQLAGITPAQVGYLEACAYGSDAVDGIEIASLAQAYRQEEKDFTTAMGSVEVIAGYLGPAAGLAGLVHTALCLYQRFFPGIPTWSGPKLPALWRAAPFYVPLDSRPWFALAGATPRIAGLSLIGRFGSCAHVILEEPGGNLVRPNQALAHGGLFLFPQAGDTAGDLLEQLQSLKAALDCSPELENLAEACFQKSQANDRAGLALAIVGHSTEEIAREVDLALKALPRVFDVEGEWQTPLGSYFTARPVGKTGEVALVYPGAFNSYPGVGKDLLRLFPSLHLRTSCLTHDLGHVLRERMLYPRSLFPFSKEELDAQEASLLGDPIAMLITGTALAVMYTHILQETLGVRAAAAFGYSLGENSMIYARGVWASQADEAAARLENSSAFRERLAGPQEAVREYWGIQRYAKIEGPLWSNYLVMAGLEQVRDALAGEPQVYLTHVNTPRQVVIGGDPQACQRVISRLKCSFLQAPFDYALHCAPMCSEFEALKELHSYPIENTTSLRLYSAADYAPLALDQQVIADKIAHMLTSPLDFPRLVKTVYAHGARVFIEAGAGANCARWIDETLRDEPHLALSMNRRGMDDYHALVRLVARLFSHGVPLRFSALYPSQREAVKL